MEKRKFTKFTDELMLYQRTGIGYEGLIKSIGLHVYSILKSKYKMDEDDRSDFFCMFYPKIPNMIKRFEYHGTPFEIYLNVSLKWNMKSFRISIRNSIAGNP